MTNNNRFIVYADFLGTKHRYSTPTLVVRGRELLEQALDRCVVPHLNTDDMHLYVYSDTVVVTCPRLCPLLKPVADLFGHFVELHDVSGNDDMTLWLRAAISHGTGLRVEHLQTSERIRTIPLIDTSLPTAYQLESIRKGSRVFVDPNIPDAAFAGCEKLFVKWQSITGHGNYAANVREYLWPAKHYEGDDVDNRLGRKMLKLNEWWGEELHMKEWSPEEYKKSRIHHIDETLKLFVRTCSIFCSDDGKKAVLFALLPTIKEHHDDIHFKWGLWFQALRGIVEGCEMNQSTTREVKAVFEIVKSVLSNNNYFRHFVSELKLPDYAPFRTKLCEMGLLETD